MESITAVALRTDALLPLQMLSAQFMTQQTCSVAVVNCTKVQDALVGFVLLTLEEEKSLQLELTVPSHSVLWMLRGARSSEFGFHAKA